MATIIWSTLTNGQTIAFNPAVDVLFFDNPAISAASLTSIVFSGATAAPVTITVGGVAVSLQTSISSLTSTNVTFADGSRLLVGDDTPATVADSGNNTLVGGAGSDFFFGLAGSDSMSGGAGNDFFSNNFISASFGNDTIDGGTGSDTLALSATSTSSVTVNLVNGTAVNAQGSLTLSSIETVLGTAGNDSFTGGNPANGIDAQGNNVTERFRGNGGNDTITGGGGTFFTVADYANNTSSQAISANLFTGIASDGRGGTDTLVNVDSVRGGAGNDVLTGGSLSRGTAGTFFESFRGNAGNDTLNGNNGQSDGPDASGDRADYGNNTSSQAITVDLASGTALDGLGGTDTLIDIDEVYGGFGNDRITGDAARNSFDGGAGNDTLDGGGGTDTARFQQSTAGVVVNLSAGSITVNSVVVAAGTANDGMGGTDTLISIESVRGSDFADYIRGSDDPNVREVFFGDAGDDTFDGGAGIDYVSYGDVPQVLGGVNILLNGTTLVNDRKGGTDTLLNIEGLGGTHFNDTLAGGDGTQWFRGNGGNDSINGGDGSDWVSYLRDPSAVTVNLEIGSASDGWNGATNKLALGGTDTLTSIENVEGSAYNDMLTGNGLHNELHGLEGNDSIDGGMGDDTIDGGIGADSMSGGGGNDLFHVDDAGDAVNESPGGGTDSVLASVSFTLAIGSEVENIILTGAAADATGSQYANTIVGNGSNNTIRGEAGNDVLGGGGGNDTLYGDAGEDQLYGEGGDDVLLGGDDYDLIFGGEGNDLIVGQGSGDIVFAQSGNDLVDGGAGTDVLFGQEDNDILFGDAADDQLIGAAGDDIIMGERGGVTLTGGNDWIYGDTEFLSLTGGNDLIDGDGGNDVIVGGGGNDVIDGDHGNDIIEGNAGADILVGSDSSLAGGATNGSDLFIYRAMTDAGDAIYGFDIRVGDNDGIDLRPLFDALGYAGNTPRADGFMRLSQSGANALVEIDADGAANGANFTTLITLVDRQAIDITDSFFLFQ